MKKQPFEIGEKVLKWAEWKETLSPRIYTVTGVRKSPEGLSASGWMIDCSSEECPHCGNKKSNVIGWDSAWFVKCDKNDIL